MGTTKTYSRQARYLTFPKRRCFETCLRYARAPFLVLSSCRRFTNDMSPSRYSKRAEDACQIRIRRALGDQSRRLGFSIVARCSNNEYFGILEHGQQDPIKGSSRRVSCLQRRSFPSHANPMHHVRAHIPDEPGSQERNQSTTQRSGDHCISIKPEARQQCTARPSSASRARGHCR
jgi:hypothetical protein